MRTHASLGDPVGALRTYAHAERCLAKDFGISVSSETRSLRDKTVDENRIEKFAQLHYGNEYDSVIRGIASGKETNHVVHAH